MSLQTRVHGLARLIVAGEDRQAFLHNMTTANVRGLPPGAATAAAVVDQRGVLIDWGWVHAGRDAHCFVGHGTRLAQLQAWLERYVITEDVTIMVAPSDGPTLLVAGGKGERCLAEALGESLGDRVRVEAGGRVAWRVGRGPAARWLVEGPALDALETALQAAGVPAADRSAWDLWRVANRVPCPEAEADDRANPWELGLDDAIALDKGCYLGQEVVARLRTYDKVQRRLAALAPESSGLVPGCALFAMDDEDATRPLGRLTTVAPGTERLALAVLRRTAPTPLVARTEAGAAVICPELRPHGPARAEI